jgi:DNA adenine methylase
LISINSDEVTPFLKWAGGKRWLVRSFPELFPADVGRYIEPFVGSGAVFFHISPRSAVLADSNSELIETYAAIRDDWKEIVRHLQDHQRKHSRKYFYEVRSKRPRTIVSRAARFIYLNRTCWNGLYRVNLNGQFNVPVGTKTSVVLETDNFQAISQKLMTARLICSDFEAVIDDAPPSSFIFVDPPYTVAHNLNGFVKYNHNLFTWNDQIRLRNALCRAKNRGARFLVLNAYHKTIWNLYAGVGERMILERPSVLAADRKFRRPVEELVIKSKP